MSKKNKKMAAKQAAQSMPAVLSWEFPEYVQHNRDRRWYIWAISISVLLIIWAIWTANYFFAVIIGLTDFIIFFLDRDEPLLIPFSLEPTGIRMADKFYSYDKFNSFSVIYQPGAEGHKNLYFDYKNGLREHLSVPLEKTNPILVRNFLLRYLLENLDRTDATFAEGLAKTLKI